MHMYMHISGDQYYTGYYRTLLALDVKESFSMSGMTASVDICRSFPHPSPGTEPLVFLGLRLLRSTWIMKAALAGVIWPYKQSSGTCGTASSYHYRDWSLSCLSSLMNQLGVGMTSGWHQDYIRMTFGFSARPAQWSSTHQSSAQPWTRTWHINMGFLVWETHRMCFHWKIDGWSFMISIVGRGRWKADKQLLEVCSHRFMQMVVDGILVVLTAVLHLSMQSLQIHKAWGCSRIQCEKECVWQRCQQNIYGCICINA